MNLESDSVTAMNLLREGVAAANAGERARAQQLLTQATAHDAQNETAWLWLAAVTDSYAARLAHLERASELNPHNEQTQTSLDNTRRHLAGELLQHGIRAIKERDTTQAREFLNDSTKHDSSNEVAWLWLAAALQEDEGDIDETIASTERQLECVNRALELDPQNAHAQSWFEATKARLADALMQKSVDAARCDESDAASDVFEMPMPVEMAEVITNGNDASDEISSLASETFDVTAFEVVDESAPEVEALAVAEDTFAETEISEIEIAETEIAETEVAEVSPVAVEVESSTFEISTEISTSHVENSHRTSQTKPPIRTVMIVDDSPTIRKLVAIKLEKQGHRVVQAADGMEALAKINDELPDLVLLDVTMPRLDGYQLCKLIKTGDATKHIPVVMLSGKDGFFDKVRGKLAGSTAYLTKPFDPTELARVVEEQCNLSSSNITNLNASPNEATTQAEA